ncbi:MAG: cytochrome c family protein [gamma proteobacterium symbiont of Taylorina sp.]|nr:cytochrome c family protein [gamma proteobacterium symbiont of Taylorina sp.]
MSFTKKRVAFLAGISASLLGSLFIINSASANTKANDKSIHHISASVCKTCHKETYKQWKGSMHANSTAFNDPIHGTFYRKVVGDPGKEGVKMKNGKYPVCLQCHAPNAAKDKVTKLDSKPAYAEGVNCIACHTLKTFKGTKGKNGKLNLGLKAYEYTDKIQGTGRNSNHLLSNLTAGGDEFGFTDGDDDKKPNPHLGKSVTVDGKEIPALPMESNPKQLRTSDACMGCHDKRNNSHGVPLCATGDEYISSNAKADCLSCHMPTTGGKSDHSMGGGHSLAMLQRSVVFYMESKKEGNMIKSVVTMQNKQPHTMPTGAPFRNLYLKVTAYDKTGNVVWENAKGHPGKTDKKAFLKLTLVDADGKPTGPPTAKGQGKDTRLKAFEKRDLNYEIPAKDVVLVRAELYYNLLWPGLVKKFSKKIPADVTAPKLIATSENAL